MSAGPGKRFPLTLSDLERDPTLPRQMGAAGRSPSTFAGAAPANRVPGRAAASGGVSGAMSPARGAAVTAPARPILGAHLSLTSDRVRERMVERVQAGGVSNARVLDALRAVPRHGFVDPALAPQAYAEAALPIGHRQTISKPGVVAKMIEIAMNGRTSLHRVLEVGTGCGYQAAVLGRIADEVFSIERIKPLHERAKRNLRPLRAPNIRLHYGDGRMGLPASAPFDAIIVAAAGLDIPPALAEQLTIGGRLIAPVGGDSQVLMLVERISAHQWRETVLDRVFFVPLKSGVI
ncbi:MAG: protein-L-isoaspartate(D-aspartate) O-methyltransferase [Janthinobacterium lividum]